MDFSPKICYHDEHLLLARKPHGIASSWGQEECFLDIIKKYGSDDNLRKHQMQVFGEQGEYGLLNRLDTVTAGLLYFAKSEASKEQYLTLQDEHKITKIYYAQVYGVPRGAFGQISTPIYHHRDDASRMTVDASKGRGKAQEVVTYREHLLPHPRSLSIPPFGRLERDDHKTLLRRRDLYPGRGFIGEDESWGKQRGWGEVSLLKITISSGCRHQIRCHLASIGHPLVGDRLYMTKKMRRENIGNRERIELVSAGLEVNL